MVRHLQRTQCRRIQRILSIPLILLISSCAPVRFVFPEGQGLPFPEFASVFERATERCRQVSTFEAELSLRGSVGHSRLNGQLLIGLAKPASIRLVSVAPFGQPLFILVSRPDYTTLLLPREGRVLRNEPPASVIEALAGVVLSPEDLLSILTGCVVADRDPVGGLIYGNDWIAVTLSGGDIVYLKLVNGERRVVGGIRDTLTVMYDDFTGEIPGRVRLLSSGVGKVNRSPDTDLTITLLQLQMNVDLNSEVFSVNVPVGAVPLTLEELRRVGPLNDD